MSEVQIKKPWYLSKTIWTNMLMGAIVMIFPSLKEYLNEEILAAVFTVVNLGLRLISKDKLELGK